MSQNVTPQPASVELSRFQSGADFVAAKSKLDRWREKIPAWTNFLVIDDDKRDAAVLRGVLHSWLGHDVDVRLVLSLGGAMDAIAAQMPDVIFLDHLLPPRNDGAQTIPYLRELGYQGPVVVVSGKMTIRRRRKLVEAGAFDTLHKDDMNSMSVGSILLRIAGLEIDEDDL